MTQPPGGSENCNWDVEFTMDSRNPGPGAWSLKTTLGPTTEARARAFFEAIRDHRHLRNPQLKCGDEIIDSYDS